MAWLLAAAVVLGGCAALSGRAASLDPALAPEAAGLVWRECPLPEGQAPGWPGANACLGGPPPVLDEAERGRLASPTGHGHRLAIGDDLYETREVGLPIPMASLYVLSKNGLPQRILAGQFTAYSPDHSLQVIAGRPAWEFAAGGGQTVIYDGRDLRGIYGLDAVYAPYELGGRLLVTGRRGGQFFIIFDGRAVGPAYDEILVAYCCEPAAYSAHGGAGRYRFYARRGAQRSVVEIAAG